MENKYLDQSKLIDYWTKKISSLFDNVILLEYNYKQATFLRNDEHITIFTNSKVKIKTI